VQVEPLGLEVAQVATGADHTCAVKKDGTLWCWGNNSMTQLGEGPTDFSPVPLQVTALGATVAQVAAGNAHTCAVTQAGELYCWGANSAGQLGNGETGSVVWPPAKVAALGNDVTAVFAAPSFTCARTKDATLWCWGQNSFGQLGDGTTADRATPGKVLIPCP
jgi:alpha-tubulin suppressor-like RCC1 family protein